MTNYCNISKSYELVKKISFSNCSALAHRTRPDVMNRKPESFIFFTKFLQIISPRTSNRYINLLHSSNPGFHRGFRN